MAVRGILRPAIPRLAGDCPLGVGLLREIADTAHLGHPNGSGSSDEVPPRLERANDLWGLDKAPAAWWTKAGAANSPEAAHKPRHEVQTCALPST